MESTEQKPTIELQTSAEQSSTKQISTEQQPSIEQVHAEQQSVIAQPIPTEQQVITEQTISTEQQTLTTNEHSFYNLPAPINRDIKVFSPPSDGVNLNKINLPDDFYNLSPNEVKSLYQSQVSTTQKLQNPGFKTKVQREIEEQEKEKRFPKTMIRVRFPNRIQIQAQFLSREKVSTIFDFVKSALRDPDRPFTLFQPPRSKLADMNISLYKANLAPSSVLTFAWANSSGNTTEDPLSDVCLSLLESLPLPFELSQSTEVQTQKSTEHSSAGPKKGLQKWLQKGILKK